MLSISTRSSLAMSKDILYQGVHTYPARDKGIKAIALDLTTE